MKTGAAISAADGNLFSMINRSAVEIGQRPKTDPKMPKELAIFDGAPARPMTEINVAGFAPQRGWGIFLDQTVNYRVCALYPTPTVMASAPPSLRQGMVNKTMARSFTCGGELRDRAPMTTLEARRIKELGLSYSALND